ncbi:hypothetical protein HanHA300_Chr15g0575971 [Helianthus annuus]|nr:hypothetical protein HanHA300_Chr15g0575971 [Helianthus annuus]KAJ0474081.1 hypothetical protein HanHA89_Chr15g0625681 [Helianthus annuus]KAJ0649645.1 hypothetical protein HanLR1_Chr15g0586671 [Helianthus annuus]KAJ0653433.1 hypothetical protein HanOQP8_Chr15g0583521 [Helianthus annuus]
MKNKFNSQSQSNSGSGSPVDRKKVQWVDNFRKQLVDIREFESRLQRFGPPLLLQRSVDVVRRLQTFYL